MLLWVFFLVTLTLSSGSHGSLPSQPLRIPRYADAIFTNSYRKVLGQLSARKLLQDIMNRQQGERNQEQGAKVRLGRQVDGVWTDQQQMALESTLHLGVDGDSEVSNLLSVLFRSETRQCWIRGSVSHTGTIKPAWGFTAFRPPALHSLSSKKECEAWEQLHREPGWLHGADNTHNGEQKTPPEEKAGL
ncbi:hypothetical protein E5288_WYG013135 [Bos mutus]|nr:hypothetical protein [Bos mutus]